MAASWAARGEGGRSWESSWSRYAPYFLLCLFAMGTFVSNEGKTFAMVHHQTRRGLKITFQGADYDALIVGVPDPEVVLTGLGLNPSEDPPGQR